MRIPAQTVHLLRADILDSAGEMVREIRAHVPEYTRAGDERHDRALRRGVDLALRRYLDLLDEGLDGAGHAGDLTEWQARYRAAGAHELRAGRGLDGLHAAVRICARVANRRLHAFAARHALPPDAVAWLGEAIFDNIDDIARAAADGYARAREADAGELRRRRRTLRDLLVADPPPSARALAEAATAASWPLPRKIAAVAIAARGPVTHPPVLPPEILTGFDHPRPYLIVPDPEGLAQVRALVNGLTRHQAAVGLPVSPVAGGTSLRWARLALDLAAQGFLPRRRVIWCADHLADLTLFQDRALVAALAERQLAPLARIRDGKRDLLAETLLAWLSHNMNANEVAAHLHLHPQTVRHRLRQLTPLFADRLRDPDRRFELQIALRADRARVRRDTGS